LYYTFIKAKVKAKAETMRGQKVKKDLNEVRKSRHER
jgi:hypothetical protein